MDKQVQGQNQTNQQNKKRSNNSLYLILLLLLGISLGFAALTTQLNILGNTTVTKQSWDIHFDNAVESTASVGRNKNGSELKVSDLGEVNIKTGDTEVEFEASLDMPKDYYEFTVDVVNDGTIDAMLSTVTPISLTTEQAKYLTYTVTYADADSTAIQANDKLAAGNHVTVRVKVFYKENVTADDLKNIPEGGSKFSSVYSMTYVQATTAANDTGLEVENQ